jgi:hypothetical protein
MRNRHIAAIHEAGHVLTLIALARRIGDDPRQRLRRVWLFYDGTDGDHVRKGSGFIDSARLQVPGMAGATRLTLCQGDPLDPERTKVTGTRDVDATDAVIAELARSIGGPLAEARAARKEFWPLLVGSARHDWRAMTAFLKGLPFGDDERIVSAYLRAAQLWAQQALEAPGAWSAARRLADALLRANVLDGAEAINMVDATAA